MIGTVCSPDCMCVKCLMADMDAHLAKIGYTPTKFQVTDAEKNTSVRTRYAKPGQRAGYGTVRLVSPAQVRYIKGLMRERDTTNLIRLPGSEDIEKMSLRGARDLIDRLLGCPMKAVEPKTNSPFDAAPAVRMASNKQVYWLIKTGSEKDLRNAPTYVIDAVELARTVEGVSALTRDSQGTNTTVPAEVAKSALDYLFKAPYAPREVKPVTETVREGIYCVEGTVFKVQTAHHGSGKRYAKRLDLETGTFTYATGAIDRIKPEHAITQAQALEVVTSLRQTLSTLEHCFVCGRELTDETSMERGIGPVCYGKLP